MPEISSTKKFLWLPPFIADKTLATSLFFSAHYLTMPTISSSNIFYIGHLFHLPLHCLFTYKYHFCNLFFCYLIIFTYQLDDKFLQISFILTDTLTDILTDTFTIWSSLSCSNIFQLYINFENITFIKSWSSTRIALYIYLYFSYQNPIRLPDLFHETLWKLVDSLEMVQIYPTSILQFHVPKNNCQCYSFFISFHICC